MFPPNLVLTNSCAGASDQQNVHSKTLSATNIPHVGIGAAPYESQPPKIRFRSSFIYNPVGRPMKKYSYGIGVPEPQPRTFDVLHTERAYLLSCLQQENGKATELLKRILPLEEILVFTQVSHERRPAKKHLGWLRCRIKETTRQEKAILARLGQLSYEIQSRERWTQVESERQQHFHCSRNVLSQGTQNMFNASLSESQPQTFSMPYATGLAQQYHGYEDHIWQPSIQNYASELSAEGNSGLDNLSCSGDLEYPAEAVGNDCAQKHPTTLRSSSMTRADLDVMVEGNPCASITHTKRHSL
jgi:hypothetical protein